METPIAAPEWTAEELVRRIESGEDVHVLDVRAPFRLESGRIDTVPADRFHNIPGSQIVGMEDPTQAGLPDTALIVVVCGLGNTSRTVSSLLNSHGLQSVSLAGGMMSWMALTVPRELTPPANCDRFLQFDRIGKGALAYAIVSDGEALLVDPPRHTDALIQALGPDTRIVGVADTHAHADYISGGPTLAESLDIPYYLHASDSEYPYDGTPGKVRFTAVEDGHVIRVGGAEVRVAHTPGHTLGSVTYLVNDALALTGDFVFVDSVGRPDLGGQTEAWTSILWESLERARAHWSPDWHIHPAHYGNEAERNDDRSVGGTFAHILKTNHALGVPSEEKFLEWILSRAGSFPDAYRRIKAVNVGLEQPTEAEMVELEAGRNQCSLG